MIGIRLIPLFSGSSGNCYYLEENGTGILLDAGRSAKQIQLALQNFDIDVKTIKAIFVTHEHSDHVKGLRVFASRHKIPVYATTGTLEMLDNMGMLKDVCCFPMPLKNGIDLKSIFVEAFPTSHDAADSCGFRITSPKGKKITLATDLGVLTDIVTDHLLGSSFVILESNHDIGMLRNGPYPYYLKQRILSDKGHLSNEDCSQILPTLVKNNTTHILLAHLSKENNMIELARQTSLCSLNICGMQEKKDFNISVAAEINLNGELFSI